MVLLHLVDLNRTRIIFYPVWCRSMSRFPYMDYETASGRGWTEIVSVMSRPGPALFRSCPGARAALAARPSDRLVAVGTGLATRPPRRSRRARFGHRAPISGE